MSSPPTDRRAEGAVASARHTFGLLLAILVLAILAARGPISEWPSTLAGQRARLLLYVTILVLQWLWVGYVWLGMRRSATTLCALIDNARWTARRWLRHLLVGAAGFIAYLAVGAMLSGILQPPPEALRGLQAMLPQTPLERVLWAGFAISAGVCEEIVYRGYLMRQARALTGSTLAAVLFQALCYSLVHVALPVQMLAGVAVLGLLLGGLAVWQRSLVPGMILHVGVGLVALISRG